MGDYNERVNKRLRTVDNREAKMQEQTQTDTQQQESDLYEHVKQGEERYDTQTYGEDFFVLYFFTFIFCKMHLLIQKHWAVVLMWGRSDEYATCSNLRKNCVVKFSFDIRFFIDTASAEQQKPTGAKQEEDDKEDDIAMDVEEEKDLQAVEAQELKPEKLNDSKASQKGAMHSSTKCLFTLA